LDTVVKGRKNQPAETWRQIADHLAAMPNVKSAAVCGWALMNGAGWSSSVRIAGKPIESSEPHFLAIGPGFLSVMKIELLGGRDFVPADTAGNAKEGIAGAAIVTESFARRYFPGVNPIGRFFQKLSGKDAWTRLQIVGYTRDVRYHDMRDTFEPLVLVPAGSDNWRTFAVRTTVADPASLAPALRAEVTRTRSEFRVTNATTQRELVDQWTRRERLLAALSLFFSVLALLLAGIGLYGVLNYSVLQRTREIGIRMALGARAPQVVREVTGRLVATLVIGTIGGLAAGLSSEKFLRTLLYSVHATDPATIATPIAILVAAALVAALPPVLRAVHIDPASALREE
jgi:predicted permease